MRAPAETASGRHAPLQGLLQRRRAVKPEGHGEKAGQEPEDPAVDDGRLRAGDGLPPVRLRDLLIQVWVRVPPLALAVA